MLTRRYAPWSELLEQTGDGEAAWDYLGSALDAATGLIYASNGQYYDPATGRFLSRRVNPGAPNPYVPMQGNPTGIIGGPLVLLALPRGEAQAVYQGVKYLMGQPPPRGYTSSNSAFARISSALAPTTTSNAPGSATQSLRTTS